MVIISLSVVGGFSGPDVLSVVSIPDEVIFLAAGDTLESANTKKALFNT